MDKEEVFNLIDEYNDLKNKRYTIKVLKNKIKAFEILANTQDVFNCELGEIYHINGVQKRLLDKAKIKYKIIK